MNANSSGRGRGRGRPSLKGVNKEDLVGVIVELLIEKVWLSGLVTGYYRNDNYYQINFLECLSESGENKVMGEFCSTTWFKMDGGPKVEWRRAGGNLVTSRDVRNYLQPKVEYKGKDLQLLGKALKADWGRDGLFVGVIVNWERVEVPRGDGNTHASQSWKVMYADEDHECGEFLFGGKCLRLDDGVHRRIFWFEGDDVEKRKNSQGTGGGRHNVPPQPGKPSKFLSVAPAGVTGNRPLPLEASQHQPLSKPASHNIEGQPATLQNKKIVAGRKPSTVNAGQRGMKRASLGGEVTPAKTVTTPCMKPKPMVANNADDAPKHLPNGNGNVHLHKQGKLRVTEAATEQDKPAKKIHIEKVDDSSKDDSCSDFVVSDSQSPEKKSKKRGRLRKLNDMSDVGNKGQRLCSGGKKPVGETTTEEHVQEYLEPPTSQSRGSGRRGGRGRGRGRGRSIRKIKSGESQSMNCNHLATSQALDKKIDAVEHTPKSMSTSKAINPTSVKMHSTGAAKKPSPTAHQTGKHPVGVNKPAVAPIKPDKHEDLPATKDMSRLTTPEGLKTKKSTSSPLVSEASKQLAASITPGLSTKGWQPHTSQSARPLVKQPTIERKFECVSDSKQRNTGLERANSSGAHRKRTVEDFKATLMRSDSRPTNNLATKRTVVGGMSDSDIARQLALNEFEQGVESLNMFPRPSKDKIFHCTSIAMKGAEDGAARKIVQSMVETLKKEKRVERRINILYLIDSILRKCNGHEEASKDYPTLISAALNGIIGMLSCDIKGYSKLKQVMKIWEGDKKFPETVMKMAKEKMELVRMQFGEEAELLDLRCKGAHIVHVPYSGPKCVPVAINNLYGSLGKDDPVKNQLGLSNIRMKYEPSRKKWDEIDIAMAGLASKLSASKVEKGNPEEHRTPDPLTTMSSTMPQFPSTSQCAYREGRPPQEALIPKSSGFHSSAIVPTALSPDLSEQCATVQVELPSVNQRGKDALHSFSLPYGGREPDSCLQQWMEQQNEREFHQSLAASGESQRGSARCCARPRHVSSNFQGSAEKSVASFSQLAGKEQASDDMDIDMDNSVGQAICFPRPPQDDVDSQTQPPLPPGPPPDDSQKVWPPLPSSPQRSFPEEAPLPAEPYPGDFPQQHMAYETSTFMDNQMGGWTARREQFRICPPQLPSAPYSIPPANHPAGDYSSVNQSYGHLQPHRGAPQNLGLPPGYGPVQHGAPPRSAGHEEELNHKRLYPRSRFSLSQAGAYPFPGRNDLLRHVSSLQIRPCSHPKYDFYYAWPTASSQHPTRRHLEL